MSRTRIKICGITRIEDVLLATQLGADAIGLVFYKKSPRYITPKQAASIIAALPPFVSSVGLFVDAEKEYIDEVLQQVPLDLLQFHGNETPADCDRYPRPYIKALRVQADRDVLALANSYTNACAILLDGCQPGTGTSFDWKLIPRNLNKPLILAGGLDANNIAEAIRQVQPYAVDVSSGIEIAPGIKDPIKIAAFIDIVLSSK